MAFSGTDNLSDNIHWKGTPGVGDFMFGLNVAHANSYLQNNKPVQITFNWFWDVKQKYHFEDPEFTIERLDYIHKLYKDYGNVTVKHKYNSKRNAVYVSQTDGATEKYMRKGYLARMGLTNWWHFDERLILPSVKGKFVFWRDTFNADVVRPWKRLIDHHGWDQVVDNFYINGYEPVELTYRTPIREAVYHINTADFVMCYDGLWHYVAKNFHKPLIVLSRSSITRLHTPEALTLGEKNGEVFHYSRNFNAVKKRSLLMPKNKVDVNNFGKGKTVSIRGDGITQLKKRVEYYKKQLNINHETVLESLNRQSSN